MEDVGGLGRLAHEVDLRLHLGREVVLPHGADHTHHLLHQLHTVIQLSVMVAQLQGERGRGTLEGDSERPQVSPLLGRV